LKNNIKDKNIVYWCCIDRLTDNDLLFDPPSKLLPELYSYFSPKENSELSFLFKCPAFTEKYKNTFLIKAPRDYYIGFEHNKEKEEIRITTSDPDRKSFQNSFQLRDTFFQMGTIKWQYYFFSNTPLEMVTSPAYHFSKEFNEKTIFTDGQFDIGKWFRPIDTTFWIKEKYNSVNIKKGDPLFYVKFNSKNKIKLTNFHLSKKIYNMSDGLVRYKETIPSQPFSVIYNLFLSKNYNQRILKEIKANLTGY
jgi:hypothetical protein